MKIEIQIITKAQLEVDDKYSFLDTNPLTFSLPNWIQMIDQINELKEIVTKNFNISEEEILSIGSEKEEWYTKL